MLAFALEQRELYERLSGVLGSPWMLAGLGLLIAGGLSLYPISATSTWDAWLLYGFMTLLVAGLVIRCAVPTPIELRPSQAGKGVADIARPEACSIRVNGLSAFSVKL